MRELIELDLMELFEGPHAETLDDVSDFYDVSSNLTSQPGTALSDEFISCLKDNFLPSSTLTELHGKRWNRD